ncbi:MAG: hypothetical protein ABI972_10015 [Acidobacteriota bacterium]
MMAASRLITLVCVLAAAAPAQAQQFTKRFNQPVIDEIAVKLGSDHSAILGALYEWDRPGNCLYEAVIEGHFTSPLESEALVYASECSENHDEFESTIFLQRINGRWEVVWNDPKLNIFHCGGLRLGSGLDFLICRDRSRGNGVRRQHLFTIDFSQPQGQRRQVFLTIEDTLLTGSPVGVLCNLERGAVTNLLQITVSRGIVRRDPATIPLVPRERKEPVFVATELFELRFRFNGSTFEPDADTAFLLEEWKKDH